MRNCIADTHAQRPKGLYQLCNDRRILPSTSFCVRHSADDGQPELSEHLLWIAEPAIDTIEKECEPDGGAQTAKNGNEQYLRLSVLCWMQWHRCRVQNGNVRDSTCFCELGL